MKIKKEKSKKFKLYIGIILIIFEFLYFIIDKYCLKCIYYFNQLSKCYICSNSMVFKGFKVASDDDTVDEIIKYNKSISRFGDGEYRLMLGYSVRFQRVNKIISNKLIEIFKNNQKDLLVGVNIPYKIRFFNRLTKLSKSFWTRYIKANKFKLAKLLNKNKKYYSATISRFYLRYKNKNRNKISKFIQKLKKIWENKDILIIEGEFSRLGIGNNLFDNTNSIKRIICPALNSFKVYDKIIKIVTNLKEKRLILIALGPTATILAYDLFKLGYQAIDIGHVDIEYEWFLRKAKVQIQIKNKYVNEAGGIKHFTTVNDKKYYRQIISKILK